MLRYINILDLSKKTSALLVGLGLAVFSFAGVSMPDGDGGGGGKTPKLPAAPSHFCFRPLKAQDNLFTLKAGPYYRSNLFFEEEKPPATTTVIDAITYQKGNTTYILPYKHKVFLSGAKSNLQAVNLKVNLNR